MPTEPERGEPERRNLRARLAAATMALEERLGDEEALEGRVGRVDDRRRKSRHAEVAERAERAAQATPPTDHTLDLGTETGVATEMARASMEPDWEDNPEHLDTPAEVRAHFRSEGMDPMDTDTPQRALFGHFLVHGMADEPGMGGRTPAELEAEHDLVVAAMAEYGHEHHTPLDVTDLGVGGGGGGSLAFDDPYGLVPGGEG